MKRFYMALVMLILIAAGGAAEKELDWTSPTVYHSYRTMVVDNGADWKTKLNLRAGQSKSSERVAQIYTGTRVEVYEDNGVWCRVVLRFGEGEALTGYVMNRYLSAVERNGTALCPAATAKMDTKLTGDQEETWISAGERVYVLAVCGDQYYVLKRDGRQGYVNATAFEELREPCEEERIIYRTGYVPTGGMRFIDRKSGAEVTLAGGVAIGDCWRMPDEDVWHIAFGAGVEQNPRVEGVIPESQIASEGNARFEGEAYTCGENLVFKVGMVDGMPILRMTRPDGGICWALGNVPEEAKRIEHDIYSDYEMECEPGKMLSHAAIEGILNYVKKHTTLDERTCGWGETMPMTQEMIERCTLHTAYVVDPASGKLAMIRAWLTDVDGSYVTGGNLNPITGAVARWGCDA